MIYAEDGESVTVIFISPPDLHELTNEDSDDENELVPDKSSRRQLRAEVEVRKPAGENLDEHPNKDHIFQEANQQNTKKKISHHKKYLVDQGNFVSEEHLDYVLGIRFGYKVWSINEKEEYLISLEVYQEIRVAGDPENERRFGKAAAPFVAMIESLPKLKLPYKFYVDNVFSREFMTAASQETFVFCLLDEFDVDPMANVKRYSQFHKKLSKYPGVYVRTVQ
ncbi:hypothetical protein ILUMI_18942 [Ignelater luminosus]|uniref:Uncharacterized protein n=1 Tax=Ignelater luminosus TaxID=2038154 RepID=A0A8K0G5X5_IGNLU|nr:hypothetical protein ILUMI_18942 [Ignelater luminosus]